ncbi:hypothetical protein ERJ70_03620 [Sediminibacillus dalangtanensis]|uniref:Uncharacterized protein n=1 Tax=Sediminibacillus dalangtanensis TaxID=2729421 RepID=A0ABX7VPC2_9BACI|nr:hypothetical protein [Sediminibacillus dalangtanensis]QTM98461.1 hypothetical protein ERJ70_03620 [Sediminibacillus dalangtanensis]
MKRLKYLAFALGIIFLSVYLYQNFIYYMIPFNPIEEYATESTVDFHLTQNLSDGEEVNAKSHDQKTCNLILEYLSNLKLKPLKHKDARNALAKKENETYLTGMLKFDQSREIFISDLFLDDPDVLHISSSTAGFKGEGYYKIVDSTFDYDYIINLIGKEEK